MQDMPKTMKAAVLTELRKALTITEIELPQQLDVGQVLVKVHYSGICGSQLGEIAGIKGEDKYLPHLLGHEGSGTVIAVGPGVRHVKPDDKVVLHWRKGAGIESVPPKYKWNGGLVNAGWITTFNEYAVVSENRITTIPDDSNLKVAALFGCAVTTGFGVVENNARVRLGESVLVFGAGGIGLNIVQASALVSAYPIIAVDLYDNRLALAEKMGATHVINSAGVDARQVIADILVGGQLDIFIDNTGQPSIIEMGYEITHPQGRVILVGVPKAGSSTKLYTLPLHFGKEITGSFGGESKPDNDILRYSSLLRAGKLDLESLITNQYSIESINMAIAKVRDGSIAGRCLINMQNSLSVSDVL